MLLKKTKTRSPSVIMPSFYHCLFQRCPVLDDLLSTVCQPQRSGSGGREQRPGPSAFMAVLCGRLFRWFSGSRGCNAAGRWVAHRLQPHISGEMILLTTVGKRQWKNILERRGKKTGSDWRIVMSSPLLKLGQSDFIAISRIYSAKIPVDVKEIIHQKITCTWMSKLATQ